MEMKIKRVNEIIGFWDEVFDCGSYREFSWNCGCKGTMVYLGEVVMRPCEDHVDTFVLPDGEVIPMKMRAELLEIFSGGECKDVD